MECMTQQPRAGLTRFVIHVLYYPRESECELQLGEGDIDKWGRKRVQVSPFTRTPVASQHTTPSS